MGQADRHYQPEADFDDFTHSIHCILGSLRAAQTITQSWVGIPAIHV